MKSFIFIFLTCFCFLQASASYAQERKAEQKRLFIAIGGFFRTDEPFHIPHVKDLFGSNLHFENVIDDKFGIYSTYSYSNSMRSSDHIDLPNDKRVSYSEYFSFHTIGVGSNWYIISSDINNRFTPYIGAGFMLSYSYDTFDIDIIESKSAVNIAYVPSLGLNIPILGNFGLRFEMKYIISIYDFELVGFDKRDINFIEINLGLKYAI